MLLQWLRKLLKTVEREVVPFYVPIVGMLKAHHELWQDKEYLAGVCDLANNTVFKNEVIHLLDTLRNMLTNSKTVDEMHGIAACIQRVENLLIMPKLAKDVQNKNINIQGIEG